MADLNGDGQLDLAAVNTTNTTSPSTVVVRLNDGTGAFPTSTSVGVGAQPFELTAADLDGDGDIDLAASNSVDNNVSILLNNGSGTFTNIGNLGVGTNFPVGIIAADLDGDGDADLATSNYGSAGAGSVSILLNNSDATFAPAFTRSASGTRAYGLAAADLDGDGDLDLATSNLGTNTVGLIRNDGGGAFTAAGSVATNGTGTFDVVAADLDGDGDIDLATANINSDNISVLKNNGGLTFTPGVVFSLGSTSPTAIVAADFNGDGFADLATANLGGSTVTVRLNDGTGAFPLVGADPSSPVGAGDFRGLTAVDLDKDGRPDLIVSNRGAASLVLFQNTTPTTADVQVQVSGPTSAVSGASVSYTVTITNAGPQTASPTAASITIPAGLTGVTFTSSATGGATGNMATGSGAVADMLTLLSGSTVTYTITGTVSALGGGSITLAASATPPAGVTDPTPADQTDSITTSITATSDLQVSVTGPTSAASGTAVSYTVTITNAGPQTASPTAAGIPIPAGLTGVTFTSSASGGATGNTTTGSGAVNNTLTLPSGASVTYVITGTVSAVAGASITLTATGTLPVGVVDPTLADQTDSITTTVPLPVSPPPPPPPSPPPAPLPPVRVVAVGTDAGGPAVAQLYNVDGSLRFSVVAFAGFGGGVHVTAGDINGDGTPDLIVGAGAGAPGGHVKVFDGNTGAEIRSFFAFDGFMGGVTVAAGDIDNDGLADIIVGAGAGAPGGHVKVFSGLDNSLLRSFFAFEGYSGGVGVAAGDVNGDRRTDVVVISGLNSTPHVKVFSGVNNGLLRSFLASGLMDPLFPTLATSVAAGDTNGDGLAEIMVGSGGPNVRIFSGSTGGPVTSFNAFPGFTGSVRVGTIDKDGDGLADVIVGVGPGGPGGHVKVFDGVSLTELSSFLSLAPTFSGGVFVG